jgi:chromosome segregation ATPase
LEKAWKASDTSHEKEQTAKETIQSLKLEIANLTKLVEQGAGLTTGQENNVSELMKSKDELTAERDKLLDELVNLRGQLDDSQMKEVDFEKKIEEANTQISNVKKKLFLKIPLKIKFFL